ncbi:unnamed protein product [Nesidiocoris tenuis]|nr:acylphosphatase [Nesidiocoris tenuis]CAB0008585.1 unnamed protein product [Nesidiocoris tenuis]
MAGSLVSLDFEVFGLVQGVCFRAYTQKQAVKLGLVGWCQNTSRDTVVGSLQGDRNKVNEMKDWLQNTGSPHSRIDKAVFTNEQLIEKLTFNKFDIRK